MKPIAYGFLSWVVCAACLHPAGAADWFGPDEQTAGKFGARDLDQLLAQNKPAQEENIKVVPLSRNARSANVLVQVRDREPLHRHIDSDITVFMLRGEGEMRIGKQTHPVKAGDVIHVERNAIHAYINRGAEPAAALVVYSPAPGPKDRILVREKEPR
jgi:quercetin dioxygenase-like cupin family protein